MPPNISPDPLLSTSHQYLHDHLDELDWGAGGGGGGGGDGGGAARSPDAMKRNGLTATVDTWLEARRAEDGAEGLWRLGDDLYDLTDFVDKHPGGADWLNLTKGTDITEAFYAHHIFEDAEKLLPKLFVRSALTPRPSPYTFHRDGFYMQLRSRVQETLAATPREVREAAKRRSRNIADWLAVSTLSACYLAAACNSYLLGTAAGLLLSVLTSCAHNFFHQKHNWRRYYFDLSIMSSREWMVSHVLSHHMYPNTAQDLEVTLLEPFLRFLPEPKKNSVQRFASWIYCHFFYATVAHGQLAKRLVNLQWSDAVCLIIPASMAVSGAGLWETWLMWTWVLVVSSAYFSYQGLSAGHHHPDKFHEGDAIRQDRDFGLLQLDTTSTCTGMRGQESLFMVLTHFGDHVLHHLFPSLDHAMLPIIQPALVKTLEMHKIPNESATSLAMLFGKYLQLARNRPNPLPPGHQHQ